MTTEHPNPIEPTGKMNNIKHNEIIVNYNKYMGGVDLMDQMTKYYAIDRKSPKWTTKMAFHLFIPEKFFLFCEDKKFFLKKKQRQEL
jgi:hypothetical protein